MAVTAASTLEGARFPNANGERSRKAPLCLRPPIDAARFMWYGASRGGFLCGFCGPVWRSFGQLAAIDMYTGCIKTSVRAGRAWLCELRPSVGLCSSSVSASSRAACVTPIAMVMCECTTSQRPAVADCVQRFENAMACCTRKPVESKRARSWPT